MEFSILQPTLKQALTLAGAHIGKGGTFGTVAIEATESNELRISARDQDSGVNCFMPATVTRPGGILLPEKLLAELVSNLPPERVDFEIDEKTSRVSISCHRSVATIPGVLLSDGFPLRSQYAAGKPFTTKEPEKGARLAVFGIESLRKAIEATAFAASVDESRPTLTGADVSVSGIAAKFATTDGFRLAVTQVQLEQEFGEQSRVIIPASRLGRLAKVVALGEQDSRVDMLFTNNWALFTVQCSEKSALSIVEVEMSLIDAKFPDYNAIIPKRSDIGIRVVRDELKKALRVTGLYARDNANIVTFAIGHGQLKLLAKSFETGDCSVEVELRECDSAEHLSIAFNFKLLADYLDRADSELYMQFTKATRPAKISSAYSRDDSSFYIIMPMQPK